MQIPFRSLPRLVATASLMSAMAVAAFAQAPAIANAPTFESHYVRYTYAAFPSFAIAASNQPDSYGAVGLPPGANFDATRGWVYYNDAQPGIYNVTLTAANAAGTGSGQVRWSVHPVVIGGRARVERVRIGSAAVIYVVFNSEVVVTGTPEIPLTAAGWPDNAPRRARYARGSGTATLEFELLTTADDFAPDGAAIGDLILGNATIAHASGVAALTRWPALGIGENPRVVAIYGPPVITSAPTAAATVAAPFNYTITAKNQPTRFGALGLPPGLSVDAQSGAITGTPTTAGTFAVTLQAENNYDAGPTSATLTLTISDSATSRPTITTQPASVAAVAGSTATFTAATDAPGATFQWQFNGAPLAGATSATLAVEARPANAGFYSVAITASGQTTLSNPAVFAVTSTQKVTGDAVEVGANIVHPNGNVYDQFLLTGRAATFTADAGQVTRVSWIDLSDDIVQAEFAGAGSFTIVLDVPTGPAEAKLYRQPGVAYMRGHAGLIVSGADSTTNVAVFSVGRITAVNPDLFRNDVSYDGVADLAFLAVLGGSARFGGIGAADANFWATSGWTGIYAPGVTFTRPVNLCEITATESAIPVLLLGAASETRITGGDLLQTNGRAVQVSGLTALQFVNGVNSHGQPLPAQTNRARLEENGRDVTAALVKYQ